MATARRAKPKAICHAVTPDRWADLERLFGPRGACGGCWCMCWRLPRAQYLHQKGEKNRRALQVIVNSGCQPGILAYVDGEPAGWCAVAPRTDFPALGRSRVLKPVDDKPVWSVSCLFVAGKHRRKGLTVALLRAAVEHVRQQGGTIVEGYPIEPKKDEVPAVFAWTGLASAFKRAGFVEVARGSPTRPIMRYSIKGKAKRRSLRAANP